VKFATSLTLAMLLPAGLCAQQPAPIRVQGTVFDSLSRTPIAHALVQFARANGDAGIVSDSTSADGKFTVLLQPGTWIAGFMHPRLDSLMIELPARQVEVVPGKRTRVALAIPSPRTLLRALCDSPGRDSAGVLHGYVLRAPQQSTLDSGGVYVQWTEIEIGQGGVRSDMLIVRASVSPDGSYRACGVPANTQVVVWAQRGTASTGLIEAEVPKSGIARQDLVLDPEATREIAAPRDSTAVEDSVPPLPGELLRPLPKVGVARFSGVVRDAGGKVLENVRARITDHRPARTNGHGVFVLDSLAQGTQTLEVRALGYFPESRVVNVTAGAPPDTIRLTSLKAMLDTVRVTAERVYDADVNGFEQRRRSGVGSYFSHEQIARRHPPDFINVIYGLPFVRVEFSDLGVSLSMRSTMGRCSPAVFLDGIEQFLETESDLTFLVQPEDIAGVEIYTSGALTPAQFWSRAQSKGCGSIVVWTQARRPKPRLPEKPPP
jgi:hypothetical protein